MNPRLDKLLTLDENDHTIDGRPSRETFPRVKGSALSLFVEVNFYDSSQWKNVLSRGAPGQNGFAIGVDRTRISCRSCWNCRTACDFPRRKSHIIVLGQCRAAGNPGKRRVFSWFSPKENHTSRPLSGHSNCETGTRGVVRLLFGTREVWGHFLFVDSQKRYLHRQLVCRCSPCAQRPDNRSALARLLHSHGQPQRP